MTDLGAFGDSESVANGIDDAGQVVGNSCNRNGTMYHAFVYGSGQVTDLGTLGGPFISASAINDNGIVVGSGENSSLASRAFLYADGVISDLGTLPGYPEGEAVSINASGQVVGTVFTPAVAGSANFQAFLYASGTMSGLGTLPGFPRTWATGINDSGKVVGYAQTLLGDEHAFLYSGGDMIDLGTLDGSSTRAWGINNSGQVVGGADNGDAFLYSNGCIGDLNSLLANGSGWTLTVATAINDNGQIVGYGTNPSGQQDAFLLTPTPEPSTLAFLGAGAIALAGYVSWRRRAAGRTEKPTACGQPEPRD